MPDVTYRDVNNTSGNPGIYAGFMTGPTEEETLAQVVDNTPTTPAIAGKVLGRTYVATNTGGNNFAQTTVANQGYKAGSVGVVKMPAPAVAGTARIQTKGVAAVFIQTTSNANKAIVAGDPLCVDGAGNLTSAPATPVAGTVVAYAMAGISGSLAAALSQADFGGAY